MNAFVIDHRDGKARVGEFKTAHGSFETPAFMPVGTNASVKGVHPARLKEVGAQIILTNAYHLHIRPGDELINKLGGIHSFMAWDGPILSDSGGFQVYSLARLNKVSDEGVVFQSHVDGSKISLTPSKVIEIQKNLGVDISMVLDECLPYPSAERDTENSLKRTITWAKQSKEAVKRFSNTAFAIVQGGFFENLRRDCCAALEELDFPGYAIGGVSVGEPPERMLEITEICASLLPENKPRYLMGVGTPSDIVQAVALGVDMFDCVIPTRSARFGRLYNETGYLNIRNSAFREDQSPIDQNCSCTTCQSFSRAYLAHLHRADEPLFIELASIHNLHFYQSLCKQIREAIKNENYTNFKNNFLSSLEVTALKKEIIKE